jgi:hypothetical protein
MQTLSHGIKKPNTGDRGFFSALEDNFQQLNDHTHNGIDSEQLNCKSIAGVTGTISSASWVDLGDGNYRFLVTVPAGVTYDDSVISVRLSTGHVIYPSIEKVSNTQFYVYVNDNTLNLTLVYR